MKRKVLFVITKGNFGGAQRYVYELATSLPKDQYEVSVAMGAAGVLKDKLNAAGIRTHTIESFQRDINIGKEVRSFVELWRLYRRERPDVVHLNSSKAGGTGALIARLAGIPRIVYTTHGWAFLEPRAWYWRALVWCAAYATALLAHRIILVSAYERTHTHMPFILKKLSVIHTALPPLALMPRAAARSALAAPSVIEQHHEDIWLATIAELTTNKNLYTAIDAVAAFNAEHTFKMFYSIIGDGELREALSAHIADRGMTEYVTLLGYVEEARTYLHAFDIFLLPSHKEGLPYALLEAGAAGLPVIASKVGGIPEVVTDGIHGLLVDPEDTHTVTTALTTFATNTSLRTACADALHARVMGEYTLPAMIAATIRIYE